jgi:hypothetical protein
LPEVFIDGFELLWQWVNASDGEGEVRSALVGQAKPQGLDAEPEAKWVSIERLELEYSALLRLSGA